MRVSRGTIFGPERTHGVLPAHHNESSVGTVTGARAHAGRSQVNVTIKGC